MPDAIWSGSVSFGLVAVPVSLVAAVRDRETLHMLDARDHVRLRRRFVCTGDGAVVGPDRSVRGYEVGKGKYVVVSDDELDRLALARSQSIEILDFVDEKDVDPRFYDRPYYLAPREGGRPYRLLAAALADSGKVGIAKFVMHAREHLVALKSVGGILCLFTLHHAEDLVGPGDAVPDGGTMASSKDVEKIARAIGSMEKRFSPGSFTDVYHERLLALVRKRKKAGKTETISSGEPEEGEEAAGPRELERALKESLGKARRRRKR